MRSKPITGHDAESKYEAKAALNFAGLRRPAVAQALPELGLQNFLLTRLAVFSTM
jgi:hypothetical protein